MDRASADEPTRTPLPEDFRLESTVLTVADLERSADWYREVVGLTDVRRSEGPQGAKTRSLGVEDREIVRLQAAPGARRPPRQATGLYHHAVLLPTRAALAGFTRRLVERRTPVVGASDHHVSEAIYLEDPDGHGVEVYADRPRETWSWRDGQVAMTTEALDLDDLLSAGGDAGASAPPDTTLGHVHLKVRDAGEAERFYRERVGFDLVARFPGATFLSTGRYHHHLGANHWESRGGPRPPDGSSSLLAIRASLRRREDLDALRARTSPDRGSRADGEDASELDFRDPSGNRWIVHVREG